MACSCDILVIGCGAAGLAAANEFRGSGLQCVVLEASTRPGGRAHCSDELSCGVEIDHGAAWLHGHSQEHPLLPVLKEVGINVKSPAWGQSSKTELVVLFDGHSVSVQDQAAANAGFKRLNKIIEEKRTETVEKGLSDVSWSHALIEGVKEAATLDDAVLRLLQEQEKEGEDEASESSSESDPWSDEEHQEEEPNCDGMPKGEETFFPDLIAQRAALFSRIGVRLENWEGLSLLDASVLHAESCPMLEGPNADVVGCYGNFLKAVTKGIDVRFGQTATSVGYSSSVCDLNSDPSVYPVTVTCESSDLKGVQKTNIYHAQACIVTLPLGVLKQKAVNFVPPLPDSVTRSISLLGVVRMEKLELSWSHRWWPDAVKSIVMLSEVSTATAHPWPWFHEPQGMRSEGKAVLVCYLTGQFAEQMVKLGSEEAGAKCVAALRRAFPEVAIPDPVAVHLTSWTSSPHSLGSWTIFAAGSTPGDASTLSRPLGGGGCLTLAGEHTCDGAAPGLDMGTVHGAWLSGKRAASNYMHLTPLESAQMLTSKAQGGGYAPS